MEYEPLFVFDSNFAENLRIPYESPARPNSKAEAVFFLSPGGRHCLGNLLYILEAHISGLKNGDPPVYKDVAVRDYSDPEDSDEAPVYYPMSDPDFATYFSGFGLLGEWLSETCTMAFGVSFPHAKQVARCLDHAWMTGFARSKGLQNNILFIESLHTGLWEIAERANRIWTVDLYWTLVLERLKKAADECDRQYVDEPIQRDINNSIDRKNLFNAMKNTDIFDVSFNRYTSEDEWEALPEAYYQPQINWLKDTLLSEKLMNLNEVYQAFVEELPLYEPRGSIKSVPQKLHATQPKVDASLSQYPFQSVQNGQPPTPKNYGHSNSEPMKWDYSEPMTKTTLLQLAKENGAILTKKGVENAIKRDPSCCKSISRKQHQFDMNTVEFDFLKNRKK